MSNAQAARKWDFVGDGTWHRQHENMTLAVHRAIYTYDRYGWSIWNEYGTCLETSDSDTMLDSAKRAALRHAKALAANAKKGK